MKHSNKWFRDRIGKVIYRKRIPSCKCEACQMTAVKVLDMTSIGKEFISHTCKTGGLKSKYIHADYLFLCSMELGIEYQDKIIY